MIDQVHLDWQASPQEKGQMLERRMRGFSLIELIVVLAIGLTMMGIVNMALTPVMNQWHADESYDMVLMQLRSARERAIEERKQYIVCFGAGSEPSGALTPLGAPSAQSVQLYRWDAGTALSAAVQINSEQLASDVFFQTETGLPNSSATTPDGFGIGSVPLAFDTGAVPSVPNQVLFQPDGSAQDTNGNLNSGIVYLARNSDLYSTHAITLFGASGRIRGWRLSNNAGVATWLEQ